MDRQLLERLIGAGVLVVCLVIVAPAILDGPAVLPEDNARDEAAPAPEARRVHTIRLDGKQNGPPVAREVAPVLATGGESEDAADKALPETARIVRREPENISQATTEKPPASPQVPARQNPEPPAAKPAPTPTAEAVQSGWVVQLGSFSSRENAQKLADRVGKKGFPVFLASVDRAGKKLYRVRVGPQESRPQAEELAGRLNQAGYVGQVTRQ